MLPESQPTAPQHMAEECECYMYQVPVVWEHATASTAKARTAHTWIIILYVAAMLR